MAKTKHGLQETTNLFQIRGVVNGTEKENFYREIKTRTQKDMRIVNFGVEIEPKKNVYLTLSGLPQENVYFSKKEDDGKNTIKEVAWSERSNFNEKGYNLIGVRLGVEKNENGENIKETLPDFDACKRVGEALKDGSSVFTKGIIEFSSFKDENGNLKRSTKFVPRQISLCSKDIDFENEKYEVMSNFNQQIIFMGIEKNDDHFIVSAKVVTYQSIEDTEFILEDTKLANLFKKNLKPYTAIKVYGNIRVTENITEEESEDTWGAEDPTKQIDSSTRRDLVITGAYPQSIDTDTFSQDKVEEAIKKLKQSESAESDWETGGTEIEDVEDDEW